ncbi:MAG TPA: NUDIX hydrolase [Dehalococcoidia bacterium]|nr:NUDIX hydrolase [Dehalococcoidia bacterium]
MRDDEPEPPAPRVLSSQRPFRGNLINVRVDTVETAGGTGMREVVEHPGAVLLIAMDDYENVFLVRQYRHPVGRVLLELPAGTIDEGEQPEVCAVRELREETGFRPRSIESLGGFFLSPGYSNEYIHLFLATGVEEAPLETGDEEDLRALRIPFDEALRLIDSGEIRDAKSIAALLLFARRRGIA